MLYETLKAMKEAARDRMYAMEDKRRTEDALFDTEEQLMEAKAEIKRLKELIEIQEVRIYELVGFLKSR